MIFPDTGLPDPRPEPAIQITIADTGQGISADRLSRIFDPFYTTKEKGLGLGMAIAHRIVEDHRGTIDVQSKVGLGSTFTVCIPLSA
jgi:signal transduction histidine kinase